MRNKYTLAAARVNAGLTQQQAADKVHVTKVTLGSWERGQTKISYPCLMALAQVYGIQPDDFSLPVKFPES